MSKSVNIVRPCTRLITNAMGEPEITETPRPCSQKCYKCGFNPTEQERRFKDGWFTSDGTTVINGVVYTGLKRLNFQRMTP